ncbi:MAG: FKBP-type peptidyl-prolyl cis-trans isomerase [Armatimonadetes bacterium]|nr:FKBP-type peptidyl-prolyl cis-trans isomerase [Armatimonadota bacterium]
MRWIVGVVVLTTAWLSAGCQKNEAEQHPVKYKDVVTSDTKVGDGQELKEGDIGLAEYTGTLDKDGTQFDSNDPKRSATNKNPLAFVAQKGGGIIDGLWRGMIGMKVGGERKVTIPWSLGYGAAGSDKIPAYSDLVFNVRLLDVVKKGEESTVEVEDLQPGTGATATNGSTVEVHYVGKFVNGRVFDDTRSRKKTVTFTIGKNQVISGFEKGLEGMQVGGKRRITVPPAAGWGNFGHDVVPGNQVLIYDVELVSVKQGGS